MTTGLVDSVVFALLDTPTDVIVFNLALDEKEPTDEKRAMLDELRLVLSFMCTAYKLDVEGITGDGDSGFRLRMLGKITDLLAALARATRD